jgi:hypothetical protein
LPGAFFVAIRPAAYRAGFDFAPSKRHHPSDAARPRRGQAFDAEIEEFEGL